MAKKAVEVRECDRCGKEPANTWLITGPEGGVREIELCDRHGAPVANAYALARAVSKKSPRSGQAHRAAGRRADASEPPAPAPAESAEPVWR